MLQWTAWNPASFSKAAPAFARKCRKLCQACHLGRLSLPHYSFPPQGTSPADPSYKEQGHDRPGAGLLWRKLVQETGLRNSGYGADKFGFTGLGAVHWNQTAPVLYEHAVAAREATIVEGGALCAQTGVYTGRSPKDKYTVVDDLTESSVWWEGNRKISQANFERLYEDFIAHARGRKLFAQDLYGGADPTYRIKTRVFTELAWHSLFIRQLLIRPQRAELAS